MESQQGIGKGAGGHCVCMSCGNRIPHRRGVPCLEERCPKCGKAMLREGSPHHQAAIEKREKGQREPQNE
jgi:predicted RNA-binding Zn-ribbon protein involved in translation (DUF1610 family)